MRQQWEYTQIAVPLSDLMPQVTNAGKHGWEVCGMVLGNVKKSVLDTQQEAGFVVLLKRPIDPSETTNRREENGQRSTQGVNGHGTDPSACSVGAAVGAAAGSSGPAAE